MFHCFLRPAKAVSRISPGGSLASWSAGGVTLARVTHHTSHLFHSAHPNTMCIRRIASAPEVTANGGGASDASAELTKEIVALRLARDCFLMAEEVDSRMAAFEQHIMLLQEELGRRHDEIRTQEREQRAVVDACVELVELVRMQARSADDDLRRRVIALEKPSLCEAFKTFVFALLRVHH